MQEPTAPTRRRSADEGQRGWKPSFRPEVLFLFQSFSWTKETTGEKEKPFEWMCGASHAQPSRGWRRCTRCSVGLIESGPKKPVFQAKVLWVVIPFKIKIIKSKTNAENRRCSWMWTRAPVPALSRKGSGWARVGVGRVSPGPLHPSASALSSGDHGVRGLGSDITVCG